jgi:hypothetical protein
MRRPGKRVSVRRKITKVVAAATRSRSEDSSMPTPNDVFIVQRCNEYKVRPATAIVRTRCVRFSNLTDHAVVLLFPKGFAAPSLAISAGGSAQIEVKGVEGAKDARGEYAYAVFVDLAPRGTAGEFATGESSPRVIIDG